MSAVLYRCGHCGIVLPPPTGAVPVGPVEVRPFGEVHRIRVLNGWSSAATALIWLASLFHLLKFVPAIRAAFTGEPVAVVRRVLSEAGVWDIATGLLFLVFAVAAVGAFLTWLFLARLNLNAFPEAAPAWGQPWAITGWLLPVIGVAVVADVARQSVDGYAAHEGQRYAARAWWWFAFVLAAWLLPSAGIAWSLTGFAGLQIAHTGVFITPPGVGLAASGICALIAASRISSVMSWVTAEQHQRVERRFMRV